jgi:hypothetical protein
LNEAPNPGSSPVASPFLEPSLVTNPNECYSEIGRGVVEVRDIGHIQEAHVHLRGLKHEEPLTFILGPKSGGRDAQGDKANSRKIVSK